ncbi:chemotaxis protein CheW [candidate division KSB1 bacterium]
MGTEQLFKETIDITLELIFDPNNQAFKNQFLKNFDKILSLEYFTKDDNHKGLKEAIQDFALNRAKLTPEHLQQVLEIIGKLKEYFEKDKSFEESDAVRGIIKIMDGDLSISSPAANEKEIEIIGSPGVTELSDKETEEIRTAFFEDVSEYFQTLDEILIDLESNPDNQEIINRIFRIFHSIKGSGSSIGYKNLSEVSHTLEDIISSIREGKKELSSEFFELMFKVTDIFTKILKNLKYHESIDSEISEIHRLAEEYESTELITKIIPAKKTFPGIAQEIPEEETIRIKLHKIDKLIDLSSELVVKRGFFAETLDNLIKIRNSFYDKIDELESYLASIQENQLNTPMFDLEISIARLTESIDRTTEVFSSKLEHFFFMSNTVQEEILKVRMIPFSTITSRLKRTVRDISKDQNKQIDFKIEGLDTEIDRRILDLITDPIIHILRNAIDHGVEDEEDRLNSGKNRLSTIKLTAFQRGSQAKIRIEDDGRGIDAEKIKSAALEKRLITAEEAEKLTDSEVFDLIFRPGFSTKNDVSEVSGRGVGLDIVNSNLKELHGIITVESEIGTGTKFSIIIPLTLAVSPSLVFKSDNFRMAIISSLINRVFRIKNEKKTKGIFYLDLNKSRIPVLDLKMIFGNESDGYQKDFNVIMLGTDKKGIGIIADEFLYIQELIIRKIGKIFEGVKHLSGCAVDENGNMIYFLNVKEIIDRGLKVFSKIKENEDIPVFSEEILSLYDTLQFLKYVQSSKERDKNINGLSFLLKEREFMIESSNIQKIFRLSDLSNIDYENKKIKMNGIHVPLIDLRNIIPEYKFENNTYTSVIFTGDVDTELALVVDNIKDFRDFPVEKLKRLKIKSKILNKLIIYGVL